MSPTQRTLIDFGALASSFRALDDRVMGGVSRSSMEATDDGNGVFAGDLSLENNGGFASVRASNFSLDLSEMSTLILRVRGDGRRYKLRLHDDRRMDGIAFETVFETVAGEWVELNMPLDEFRPVWRGRLVPDAEPLDRSQVVSVGLMLADGQAGSFELELDSLAGR